MSVLSASGKAVDAVCLKASTNGIACSSGRADDFSLWRTARVNIDYHVEFERHYYSVPYQLTGETVELRVTAATLEIFHQGTRITNHARSGVLYQATTVAAHRPKSHQRHLE